MSTTQSTSHTEGKLQTKPREDWIVRRREHAARTGDSNVSQMHFARKGLLTEEEGQPILKKTDGLIFMPAVSEMAD